MNLKSLKLAPFLITGVAGGLVCLFQVLAHFAPSFDLFQRLEWMTYDWRVKIAAKHASTNASNLGFVCITEESIAALLNGKLGYKAGLYWPRHVYGRLVQELASQGAQTVGFDILFGERRTDHPDVQLPDGRTITSDDYFAEKLHAAGNVVLPADKGLLPVIDFRTNAWALGDISTKRDSDGILRRTKAFVDYYDWHPWIREVALQLELDLGRARVETNRIVCPAPGKKEVVVPIEEDGTFDPITFREEHTGQKSPARIRPLQKAFERLRVWDMGIVLAAHELKLDLANARVEPNRIILTGEAGVKRIIPIDNEGRLYIDWSITVFDSRLTVEPIERLLAQARDRRPGSTNAPENLWRGKLVVVGSTALGNDLTDLGATPLEKETFLTSRFWNTANSIITGRFIRTPALTAEMFLILLMSCMAAGLTWRLRAFRATLGAFMLAASYAGFAVYLYVQSRYWLPLVLPLSGLFLTLFSLSIYEAFFEQTERRRIKNVFAKIVSPNVVQELLKTEKLALRGARRKVTIFFADVRGFTEMTDDSHARAEKYVHDCHLGTTEAEAYLDEQSEEVLRTVNLYLSLIADTVKKHEGTLDKYIGDCVMAFWGSPTPNEKHALACVRAAIEAQRAIFTLNQQRAQENSLCQQENVKRAERGQPLLPMSKLLSLGTGINTGIVTVGLMGSHAHILNYTVFGREVNLAARLEAVSGRGRIIIGEATYQELLKDDPSLAATCIELPPEKVKGIRTAVKIFEVPWQQPEKVSITETVLENAAVQPME